MPLPDAIITLAAGQSQLLLIQKAKALGYKIIAVDQNPDAPGFVWADEKLVMSTYDPQPITAALQPLKQRYRICGVPNASAGPPIITAAYLCEALGIPALPPEKAFQLVHKHALAALCESHQIPIPKTLDMTTFPCVVKPSLSLRGKSGITVVDSANKLKSAYEAAKSLSQDDHVVIQEYIEGTDVTLLAMVFDGKLYPITLFDEINEQTSEKTIMPSRLELPSKYSGTEVESRIHQLANQLIQAAEIQRSPLLLSCRIPKNQQPVLIEAPLNLGGDQICEKLLPQASEYDYVSAMIKAMCGHPPEFSPLVSQKTVTVFSLPWARYTKLPSRPSLNPLQKKQLCPLSNTDDEEVIIELPDFQFYSDQDGSNRITHRVVRNKQSGLVYNNPCYTPEGFSVLFEKAGHSYGFGNLNRASWLKERIEWVTERLSNIRSVLDIGCGRGDFLFHLPEYCQLMGVDIDAGSIDSANHYFQEHAPQRAFQFLHAHFESFSAPYTPDLITMFHVLEHLPQPLDVLRHLRRMANENTRLIVEVPVIDMAAQGVRIDLCGYFSVMHLFHFSRATLHATLTSAGWQIIAAEQINLPQYNGYRVLAQSMAEQTFHPDENVKTKDLEDINSCLKIWQSVCNDIISKIESIPPQVPVVVYGAGLHSEYLSHLTPLFQQDRPFLFVDNDPSKMGTTLHGIPILNPNQINWRQQDFYVIPSTFIGTPSVIQSLLDMGFPHSKIIALYKN